MKKSNDLNHPMQAKYLNFNRYIYILYHKSNILYNVIPKPGCYLYEIILLVNTGNSEIFAKVLF